MPIRDWRYLTTMSSQVDSAQNSGLRRLAYRSPNSDRVTPGTPSRAASSQRLRQFRLQVVERFHAHAQAHQVVGDAQLRAAVGGDGSVGHDRRVVDQALHATE